MKRLFIILTFASLYASITGCGDQPLLDNISNNRMTVIIKGTYESNNPQDWDTTVINDDTMTMLPPTGVDSATKPSTYENFPTVFNLDIAEMKMNGDRFANYRCLYGTALTNTDPFFDGTGVLYKNNDVYTNKYYDTLQVYIRKTIFDNAHSFSIADGTFKKTLTSLFNEVTSNGYNFNEDGVLTFYDTLLDDTDDINRVFPLSVPISFGLTYDNEHDFVLELRLVVKNFIKRFETIATSDDKLYSYHYFAFSDWLRDRRAGDTYAGGNLHAAARWYIPGQTVTISGSCPVNALVIAVPANDDISHYYMNSTDRTRPSDDYAPRISSTSSDEMVCALEYLVDYEKYKYDYNGNYLTMINTSDVTYATYTSKWTTYETRLNEFRIPPLATYSASGTYTLTNVQAGKRYRFYYATAPNNGELPDAFTSTTPTVSLPATVDLVDPTIVDIPLTAAGASVTIGL